MPPTNIAPAPRPWWHRWFIQPVARQLTQGISPEKLGWTIAAGIVLGIFPIMGTTTFICFAAAWLLKLNQPVIQTACHAVYALHLALILVFIRAGQALFGADPIPFSISQLLGRFTDDPWQFAKDFGVAALQGITAWALVAPLLLFAIKLTITPVLGRFAKKLQQRKELAA
ncbi:MAG: DUF2062 domain-containing protein [Verrucomicrobiaceae bacterium]